MDIVLDSTCLHDDHLLKSTAIGKLVIAAKEGGHNVYLPEVVVREVEKHYKESLTTIQQTVQKSLKDFRRKAEESLENPITESLLKKKIKKHGKDLKLRIKDLEISILPLPSESHSLILDKVLGSQKPFHISGKGYQDALIWATILEKAEEFSGNKLIASPRIIFVSNNLCLGSCPHEPASDLKYITYMF